MTLIDPPINSVISHLQPSEVESEVGVYVESVDTLKASSKAPPSRNFSKSKSDRSEIDPLSGHQSELPVVLVSITALDDGVGCVNDRKSDGSRSDPRFAIELGTSFVVDVPVDMERGGSDHRFQTGTVPREGTTAVRGLFLRNVAGL